MEQMAKRQRSITFSCYLLYYQVEQEKNEIETLTARYTPNFKIRYFNMLVIQNIFRERNVSGMKIWIEEFG